MLHLIENHVPGFQRLVAFCELSTPNTIEYFTGHKASAVYSLPARPERYRQQWLAVRTPVKNLLLAGADVANLGIAGAMMGGLMAAACLQGYFGFFRIVAEAKQANKNRQKAEP